jgi:hypothetical protein
LIKKNYYSSKLVSITFLMSFFADELEELFNWSFKYFARKKE